VRAVLVGGMASVGPKERSTRSTLDGKADIARGANVAFDSVPRFHVSLNVASYNSTCDPGPLPERTLDRDYAQSERLIPLYGMVRPTTHSNVGLFGGLTLLARQPLDIGCIEGMLL
jgi:hypothetical protein